MWVQSVILLSCHLDLSGKLWNVCHRGCPTVALHARLRDLLSVARCLPSALHFINQTESREMTCMACRLLELDSGRCPHDLLGSGAWGWGSGKEAPQPPGAAQEGGGSMSGKLLLPSANEAPHSAPQLNGPAGGSRQTLATFVRTSVKL